MLKGVPNSNERSQPHPFRVLFAATFGNAMETFDGLMYGYLAVVVSNVFFPRADQTASILLTFGAFGTGFLTRPLGSILLGFYGDRYGRRAGLTLTIWLMTVGTAMIAFAPTYEQVGLLSPIVIVVARLLQGLGASGEYGSAVALLVESAPKSKRALFASFQMSSTWIGIVLGGLVGFLGASNLNSEQLKEWGWRVPFILGLLIGPAGYYIRRYVDETLDPIVAASQSLGERVTDLFYTNFRQLVATMGLSSVGLGTYYVMFNYMPTFAVKELGLPLYTPFLCTMVAGTIIALFSPLFGALVDDRKSPYGIYGVAVSIVIVAVVPLFNWLVVAPSLERLLLVLVVLGIPLAATNSLIVILASRVFPYRSRAAGIGVSWNFSATLFGGFAPLIATYSISVSGDKTAPAYYLIATGLVGLSAAYFLSRMGSAAAREVSAKQGDEGMDATSASTAAN
jgi:MHS family proline/betaine transporter-like MFS transporter